MFKRAILRGVTAGALAGLAYGVYVALVATPLITFAESFETGREVSAVPEVVATLGSIAGGALYGLLLGAAVFGVGYFVLEPTLPGSEWTKRFLLAAAGFVVVSGVPWLVLPPVPPGTEQSLPTAIRLGMYVTGMIIGAVACVLSIAAYKRLESTVGTRVAFLGVPVGLFPVLVLVLVAPRNHVTGPAPDAIATIFTLTTVAGQIGLWVLLAIAHGWLERRSVP